MKKIALIFSTKLTNPNGASAVMRSLYNNKGSFQRNGIELNLYSPDNILKENNLVVKSDPKTKKKFSKKIIAYIKNNVPKNNTNNNFVLNNGAIIKYKFSILIIIKISNYA